MQNQLCHFRIRGPGSIVMWLLLLLVMPNHVLAQNNQALAKKYPVIPTPQEITYGIDELAFDDFSIETDDFFEETRIWKDFLTKKGLSADPKGLKFQFKKNPEQDHQEGYELKIDSVVVLSAASPKGVFYGLQSLMQLYRQTKKGGVLPKLNMADWPSYSIRGFMHDTGRNFQSIEQLKEQIDVLANYKYNVFHWHLTDNPGWRLQSKKYPQLQSEQAFSRDIGQYYTQEEFKEILAFCRERHITVIPEFDIPGHTAAFRRAFALETMRDSTVLPILLDLFDELMALADADEMPYIHIGTDEVREQFETVRTGVIRKIMEHIGKKDREVIVWREGIEIEGDSTSIQQLWAQHPPSGGHRFIDSRANYINHLDPLAGMARLFFQQPSRQPVGDSLALGGILCAWPDNNVEAERDILRQNPIYPAMVFYADAIWNGKANNHPQYWAKLPPVLSTEYKAFQNFEEKVVVHRDQFFRGKEFPYVKQTDIQWQLLGPLDHKGDVSKAFPVEEKIESHYRIDGREYSWTGPHLGGTIHLNHFFGFPSLTDKKNGTFYAYTEIFSPDDRIQDFWIGFQGWSRAGGRRGGPTPDIGQWHTTNPKIWVNGKEIEPPKWKQPNLGEHTEEIPFIDEDYFYRPPSKIRLRKGRNTVLLKIPQEDTSWKWMFTCVPIQIEDNGVREANGLQFITKLNDDENK